MVDATGALAYNWGIPYKEDAQMYVATGEASGSGISAIAMIIGINLLY